MLTSFGRPHYLTEHRTSCIRQYDVSLTTAEKANRIPQKDGITFVGISVEESKFAIRIPSSPLHDAHISQAAVLLYTHRRQKMGASWFPQFPLRNQRSEKIVSYCVCEQIPNLLQSATHLQISFTQSACFIQSLIYFTLFQSNHKKQNSNLDSSPCIT